MKRGWVTKVGGVLTIIGTTATGAAEVAPNEEIKAWARFIGYILAGFGTACMGYGIRRRLPDSQGEGER